MRNRLRSAIRSLRSAEEKRSRGKPAVPFAPRNYSLACEWSFSLPRRVGRYRSRHTHAGRHESTHVETIHHIRIAISWPNLRYSVAIPLSHTKPQHLWKYPCHHTHLICHTHATTPVPEPTAPPRRPSPRRREAEVTNGLWPTGSGNIGCLRGTIIRHNLYGNICIPRADPAGLGVSR